MYEQFEALEVSHDNGIVSVRLNRPQAKNAIDAQMHVELMDLLRLVGTDPDARVVTLTGAGNCFCAGGDMSLMERSLTDHALWGGNMDQARDLLMAIVDLDRPIIAAVNGAAVGLGATIALFCDIVIAAETARISDPHVAVGLSAGDGGALIWPELIGYAQAKKFLLTGLPITGAEAARIGLVSEAVSADALDARVAELARHIAALPAVAVRLTKKSINMALRQKIDATIEAHLGYETRSHLTRDHAEAVRAMLEKRATVFDGT